MDLSPSPQALDQDEVRQDPTSPQAQSPSEPSPEATYAPEANSIFSGLHLSSKVTHTPIPPTESLDSYTKQQVFCGK